MPGRPTEPSAGSSAEPATLPARSLSEILEELAQLSHAQQGEASEMRSAVSELSRALARLFEMIRTDRHDQRARIAQLERELAAAREQLAVLGAEPVVPPAPNDFDQLRAAAERLRLRTEQLVRESAASGRPDEYPVADAADEPIAAESDLPLASEAESQPAAGEPPLVEPSQPGPPTLRVIDGAASEAPPADLDVESDLPMARAEALEIPAPPAVPDAVAAGQSASAPDAVAADPSAPQPAPESPAAAEADADHDAETVAESNPAGPDSAAPPSAPKPARPEPVAIAPRAERKRGLRPRRRRIDARKLSDVEPAAALGSMVGAIDQLWTAGCAVDLVIAFTDGGALRVTGGDRLPLRVEEVESGAPARTTITATRRQLVPLFGRLELTDDESAPLIHGSRRDADLLVGWFDRAQRLPVEPL